MTLPPQYPIRIERASGFAELVLDRPDRRNAITGPLVEGLLAELAQMGLAASVPDEQVLEEARALAERLAAHPGRPHAATKRVSAALLGRTPRQWFVAAQIAAREPEVREAE